MTITATSDNQIRKSNIRNWTIGLQTFATGSLPRSGLVQRNVMEYRAGIAGSFRLDARELYHFGPLLGFFGNERFEIGRRATEDNPAQVHELCLQFGIGATTPGGVLAGAPTAAREEAIGQNPRTTEQHNLMSLGAL